MANSTIDRLFRLNLRSFNPGQCFLCLDDTEMVEKYVHHDCARAYVDEKEKRLKEAWAKAKDEATMNETKSKNGKGDDNGIKKT